MMEAVVVCESGQIWLDAAIKRKDFGQTHFLLCKSQLFKSGDQRTITIFSGVEILMSFP